MRIIQDLTDFPSSLSYPIMTIGVFDGVHQGHQFIVKQLAERARTKGGSSVLLTFTPHPQKVISPPRAPLLLQTEAQKEKILESLGIDFLMRLSFTRRLSLYTPEEFACQILHNHGIREIHVGSNFRFGHRRSGDIATLALLGEKFRFEVHEVEPVYFRGERVSSSRIRSLLEGGQVALANRLLGRPYQIEGVVVRGTGRGAGLGFPTANLDSANELIPATGVYVTLSHINGKAWPSVTNVGYRPTLQGRTPDGPVVETHVLDFQRDLYGKSASLDFCLRLRAERKFDSIEDLKRQISRDVEVARRYWRRVGEVLSVQTPSLSQL